MKSFMQKCLVGSAILYVDYNFIVENYSVQDKDLKENEYIQQMTMTALLTLLEIENTA